MNLQELSDAWNALRNSALGRGVKPNVSPALAELVGRRYEAFRGYLKNAPPLVDVFASYDARKWVELYRDTLRRVEKQGKAPPPEQVLEVSIVETATQVTDQLKRNLLWGLVGTGVGIGLFILGQRRKRRE